MKKIKRLFLILFSTSIIGAHAQKDTTMYHEQYRPQLHFSPKEHWINDPNGMVYNSGVYHLFYQYYPGGTTWGPMHWGHATSKDMVQWKEQPVALYPDSLGYIFSGSAVVDKNNTSGFAKKGKTPLIAIYTSHDTVGEKEGRNDFQNQNIAYSLDNGVTWVKYAGNPVVKNPGIRDFRDPKVSWNEETRKWIMTLATKDRITFFSSPNLKDWIKESEFGETAGAHGGVWECPDLISFDYKGKKEWVLIANINPGGPNGGSATQYFTGNFDGHHFLSDDTTTKWLDYGPDEYAGITWSNTGKRNIFLGWMTNWSYASEVPTERWRGAMTVPRDLGITKVQNNFLVTSTPIEELTKGAEEVSSVANININNYMVINSRKLTAPYQISITSDTVKSFTLAFTNDMGDALIVGYDKASNQYYIDRSKAGKGDFNKNFAVKHMAPRLCDVSKLQLTLIMDVASVELFADKGLTSMTSIFFPSSLLSKIEVKSKDYFKIKTLKIHSLKNIWK